MKTFLKHILPFLVGAAVGIAPYALAQDYVRFADMTGSSLVPTTNKIEALNAQIEEVKGKKPQRTLKDLLLSGDTWEVK